MYFRIVLKLNPLTTGDMLSMCDLNSLSNHQKPICTFQKWLFQCAT